MYLYSHYKVTRSLRIRKHEGQGKTHLFRFWESKEVVEIN
jgi:hypothetical protein